MLKRKQQTKTIIFVNNKKADWIISFIIYALIFLFMWEYHRWRDKPYTTFSANKAVAIAAAALFAFSIVINPIFRLTSKMRKRLPLRRSFSITASVFMLLHICLSIFGGIEKFDWAYFQSKWLSMTFGFIALVGFAVMWMTSYPKPLKKLGRSKWLKVHSFGYIFLICIVAHILALGKAPNWVKWCQTIDHPVPPGTTVPSLIITLVVIVKFIDWLILRNKA